MKSQRETNMTEAVVLEKLNKTESIVDVQNLVDTRQIPIILRETQKYLTRFQKG